MGHVNLGAGRIVYQDPTRLDVEIKERTFFANPVPTNAVDQRNAGKAVHIMGLLSAGGVHSHEDHIMAMVELAAERGAEKIYSHAFPRRSRHAAAQQRRSSLKNSKTNSPRWQRPRGVYRRSPLLMGPRQPLGSRESVLSDDPARMNSVCGYRRGWLRRPLYVVMKTMSLSKRPPLSAPRAVLMRRWKTATLIFMNFHADRARNYPRFR